MSTATPRLATGQRLALEGVDWPTYSRLLRIFAERPAVRLTYDRGSLEIMSPLSEHKRAAYLLGRFVDVLTEELGLPVVAGGSTTLRRRRRRRGLEADRCYWIAGEAKVRGKRHIDLQVDPPPDLAIEVDVTHSSLDRMGIYAALGVPEVWRLDYQSLTFQVLGANGTYASSGHSLSFPLLTAADLLHFLAFSPAQDDTAVVSQFRAWVRQQLPGRAAAP